MAFKEFQDQAQLRRIQRLLTRILGELDRVCRQLDISYVVYGGTAIGAVRHNGFVPWDDDVDVLMPRPEYERFLREAPEFLGPEYRLDNTRSRADFPYMFSKLALKNTLLIPESDKESSYRLPMFLDILPADNIPEDDLKFRLQSLRSWFWGRLLFLSGTPRPYLEVEGVARSVIYVATTSIHYSLKVLHLTPRFLQRRWESAVRAYEGIETARMADFTMRDPANWAVSYDELFPALDVPFEGITVKLAKEYDKILRRGYGDYMRIPPVQERKNHRMHEVDFGPFENEV